MSDQHDDLGWDVGNTDQAEAQETAADSELLAGEREAAAEKKAAAAAKKSGASAPSQRKASAKNETPFFDRAVKFGVQIGGLAVAGLLATAIAPYTLLLTIPLYFAMLYLMGRNKTKEKEVGTLGSGDGGSQAKDGDGKGKGKGKGDVGSQDLNIKVNADIGDGLGAPIKQQVQQVAGPLASNNVTGQGPANRQNNAPGQTTPPNPNGPTINVGTNILG